MLRLIACELNGPLIARLASAVEPLVQWTVTAAERVCCKTELSSVVYYFVAIASVAEGSFNELSELTTYEF